MTRVLVILATACVLALAAAGSASARTVWLCSPQQAKDPCDYGLKTTVIAPDESRATQTPTPASRPKVDCFYVYPTVSDQQATNATLAKDPEIRAIATYEASRYRQACRIWAPMYRQVTLQGILNRSSIPKLAQGKALADVEGAFKDYLKHSHRRGFVLFGHSQGSFVLRQLITDLVDGRPAVRRRMVSAMLFGGNVTNKEFKHVRACTRAGQTGCIVAWSMFHDPPPANALFGRTTAEGQRVVCTSPSKLGSSSDLEPLQPSLKFPGTIGAALGIFEPFAPTDVTTPWISEPHRYTGSCATTADGASYLKVDGTPQPTPVPDATWGLHLGDMNLAMGNLVTIARKQIAAYAAKH
jgi:Protein of unknown function (DUF3089)